MLAAGADLRWVQSQVGHEDAKMTLDVYTQVLQRKDPSFAWIYPRDCPRRR